MLITIKSLKGGVGKTNISNEIARIAETCKVRYRMYLALICQDQSGYTRVS